jgi:hypothetical protein
VRKYNSATTTSAESERLFSAAKLVLTDLRKSLVLETLKELLFLHHNLMLYEISYGRIRVPLPTIITQQYIQYI